MWGEPWQIHLALECKLLKGSLFGAVVQGPCCSLCVRELASALAKG